LADDAAPAGRVLATVRFDPREHDRPVEWFVRNLLSSLDGGGSESGVDSINTLGALERAFPKWSRRLRVAAWSRIESNKVLSRLVVGTSTDFGA
jgi:hypothetical protein